MPLPTVEDLKDYLIAAGLYSDPPSAIQSRLDLHGALDAAVRRWNDITHYWPFMSNGNTQETRYFDPPNSRILDLDGGLLSLYALATDQQYEANSSNSVNNSLSVGTTRQDLRDFRLQPLNAAAKGRPYTYMIIGWGPHGVTGSIAVTGEWGFCTSANMPAGANRGILALAADMLMPQITMQVTRGGLSMLQRGDETKRWDLSQLAEVWKSDLQGALMMGDFVRRRVA
jgi:hypothetical protein